MTEFEFLSASEQETEKLGAALAKALPAGTTIALNGTLGAGKTRLVQAIADACAVPSGTVTSPTFVLCQHYQGRRQLHHFDAYRLNDDDEFLQLGPEECFDSSGLTFVEWADRVERCLPREHLLIEIEVTGETARRFRLVAHGKELQAALAQVIERLR